MAVIYPHILAKPLIKCCLFVGRRLGDATLGVALYCIIQMAIMSFSLSYLALWSRIRARLKTLWLIVFFAIFGLVPYFANYSIALWKDPVFSCSLVALSLLLADLVLTKGACVKRRTWAIGLAICALTAIFTRNNGIFIVGLCCLACLVLMVKSKKDSTAKNGCKRAFLVLCIITVAGALITGPLYKALGLAGRSAESYGILLNQMANTVVHDGSMDDSDREYLANFLPLDEWENYYAPRLVDPLKNSGNFGGQLDSEIFSHWGSLLVRNPDLYLEAWVLETYGFWTVNGPGVWNYASNITAGVPRNIDEDRISQLTKRGIYPENLLGSDAARDVFPLTSYQPPVSVLFWVMVFLAMTFGLSGRKRWIVALLPSFGLMATLLVASPIWYWPRYALAVQLLIPLIVALFALAGKARNGAHAKTPPAYAMDTLPRNGEAQKRATKSENRISMIRPLESTDDGKQPTA